MLYTLVGVAAPEIYLWQSEAAQAREASESFWGEDRLRSRGLPLGGWEAACGREGLRRGVSPLRGRRRRG